MDLGQEDQLLLIAEYSNHSVLWDPKHKFHFHRSHKSDAWEEISSKFNISIDSAKQKMSSLLGSFRREKAKGTKTIGSGKGARNVYKSNWFAFRSFSFLLNKDEPRVTPYTEEHNYTVEVEAAYENNPSNNQDATLDQYSEEIHSDVTPVSNKNEPHPRKKRKIEMEDVLRNDVLIQKAIRALNEEDDQCDIFGNYVASEMKSLSSEYLRKKMKMQFLEVILKINQEDELLSNP